MIYEKRHGVMLGEKELCPGKDIKLLLRGISGEKTVMEQSAFRCHQLT